MVSAARRRSSHKRLLLLSFSLTAFLGAEPGMATDSPLQLSWEIQHQDARLTIAPVLVSAQAGLLRYELSTINQPSRRIRQAGRVELKAGEARTLTRLAIAPVSDSCPLRLSLWLPDGSEQNHDIDPCVPS